MGWWMHYWKKYSWELQCQWRWRDKVIIQPRHMHVAAHNANFEITVHTGAVLYCASTAKKRFFLELQCRWRWSDDHPGKRPHASSCMWAHMQLDACGQFLLWSPDHPKSFFKQPKIPIINSCIAHVQCLIFTHFNRFTSKIFFVSQPYTAFFSQPLATPILPYRSIALQPLNECDDCPCCHFNNSLESRTRHQLKFRSV